MKRCVNCGKEIIDTGKFCIYCSARQPDTESAEEDGARRMRAPESVRTAEGAARDERTAGEQIPRGTTSWKETVLQVVKKHRFLTAALAAVIFALIVVAAIVAGRGVVIDLAEYTDIQFSGYNGAGTAQIVFDDTAFLCDVADAMARKGAIRRAFAREITPETIRDRMNESWEDGAKITLVAEGIDYAADKTQGLSNGDEVAVSFRYNNTEAKPYGLRFKGEEKRFPVSDLAEVERFDAFAGIHISVSGPDGYGELEISRTGTEEIYDQLLYTADREQNLHNGDRVTITVTEKNGSDDFAEFSRTYGKMPEETARTFDVTGLTEVPTFDAFAGLSVTVEGVEPFGYIVLENTDDSNDIWFEADRYSDLSNGDTVTVRANPGYTGVFNAEYAEIFGQVPETAEKVLQIEGLPTYLNALADIPTDFMTDLKREAQDRLNACVSEEWNPESDRLTSGTYKGNCLLTAKDDATRWYRNQLYLIYEVNARASGGENSRDITFYFYTRLHDVQKMRDGSCYVDLTEAEIPDVWFDTGFEGHYYRGYDTLESLIGNMITSQEEMYNIETDLPL